MGDYIQRYPFLFPVFFAGMWLTITTLLGLVSGWFSLMQRYPDRDEASLITLRGQSGMMGFWVSMSRILNLSACPSGLRVAMARQFGFFSRPFFVPWGEISVVRSSFFFMPMIKLTFERSDFAALWIYPRTWERLLSSLPSDVSTAQYLPPVTDRELLLGVFLQWLMTTGFAATFFYSVSRTMAPNALGMPLAVCIAFPALVFGVGQVINFFILRRRA